jgi:Arginyl-tRNA synthetase
LSAFGIEPDRLDFLRYGDTRLARGGGPLNDDIYKYADAVRFLLGARPEAALELDMDLAARGDGGNPAYYIQYAHARLCGLIKALKTEDRGSIIAGHEADAMPPASEAERALIKQLSLFPEEFKSRQRS